MTFIFFFLHDKLIQVTTKEEQLGQFVYVCACVHVHVRVTWEFCVPAHNASIHPTAPLLPCRGPTYRGRKT